MIARVLDVRDHPDSETLCVARIGVGSTQREVVGIAARSAHPSAPAQALNGGPQMVEISRDGRRVYLTNSLYAAWDEQFYPDGIRGWMVKIDAGDDGSMAFDERFLLEELSGLRPHQVHLEGGDASSDSYCYA